MEKPPLLRVYQCATVVAAIALGLLLLTRVTLADAGTLAFLTVLATIASFLRVPVRGGTAGFATVVALPAVLIFHTTPYAVLPVLGGSILRWLILALRGRERSLSAAFEGAAEALTVFLVSLPYVATVQPEATTTVMVSGFVVMLAGFLAIDLAFDVVAQSLSGGDYRRSVELEVFQGRLLLMQTPIILAEVLCYRALGLTGFAVAFVPVLLVATVARASCRESESLATVTRRNRELTLLTENAARLFTAEGDEQTLTRLVRLLSDLVKMKACAVVRWEMLEERPAAVYRHGECIPSDQAIVKWVDAAGFAQAAPNPVSADQGGNRAFPLAGGFAYQLVLVIQTVEVVYGVLIFESEESELVSPETVKLFQFLAGQTALSLQDQLLREQSRDKTAQLEKQAETMSTILEVSNGLIGQNDVDQILGDISQAIRKALEFEIVVFALRDEKRNQFVRRAHAGLDDIWEEVRRKNVSVEEITDYFVEDYRISNSYFVSHGRIRKGDYDLVRHDEAARGEEWNSLDMLLVPLMSGEQLIGYLSVREPSDRKVPTLEKIQTLEIFVNQAVTAIRSARQYEEIKRLTFIDALTPAYNHRYFQEALRKEIHRHERTRHSFALAMIDLDNFKRFNDTYGHPVGDEILKGLVEELMLNVRDIDVVARYGGEEFAVIFPEMPAEKVREVANRLRLLVAAREFQPPQLDIALRITISIGVASYPSDGLHESELIARADAALYHAKKHGKNMVVMASESPLMMQA